MIPFDEEFEQAAAGKFFGRAQTFADDPRVKVGEGLSHKGGNNRMILTGTPAEENVGPPVPGARGPTGGTDRGQLNRLVPTHKVANLTREGRCVERELALVKVRGIGMDRIEAMRIGEVFRARVVDSTTDSFVFEVTGTTEKVNAFIELMQPIGLIEIVRTGVAALSRGDKGI